LIAKTQWSATMPSVIRDAFHVMDFGKFKGRTVGEVFDQAPDYLLWAHQNVGFFGLSPELLAQVQAEIMARNKSKKSKTTSKSLLQQFQKEVKTEIKKADLGNLDDEIPF
jgi:uncharacterized protein (DUF3820 family)